MTQKRYDHKEAPTADAPQSYSRFQNTMVCVATELSLRD